MVRVPQIIYLVQEKKLNIDQMEEMHQIIDPIAKIKNID